MTIGIYSLYWEDQDLIYIGQSQCIEKRFSNHISLLKMNIHTNYKVQDTYNKYGIPKLHILEVCSLNQLNELEIVWQKEFNSLSSLDLIEAGISGGKGLHGSSSKYSRIEILKVFRKLYSSKYSQKEIAEICKVNLSLVKSINLQRVHFWILEKYPILSNRMVLNRNSIHKNKTTGNLVRGHSTYPTVISPDNKNFTILNIGLFCKEHPEYITTSEEALRRGLNKLLLGHITRYKKWTIA